MYGAIPPHFRRGLNQGTYKLSERTNLIVTRYELSERRTVDFEK